LLQVGSIIYFYVFSIFSNVCISAHYEAQFASSVTHLHRGIRHTGAGHHQRYEIKVHYRVFDKLDKSTLIDVSLSARGVGLESGVEDSHQDSALDVGKADPNQSKEAGHQAKDASYERAGH
jgi:hypothetical protein